MGRGRRRRAEGGGGGGGGGGDVGQFSPSHPIHVQFALSSHQLIFCCPPLCCFGRAVERAGGWPTRRVCPRSCRRTVVKRKLGDILQDGNDKGSAIKRRKRVKSFQMVMMLDNLLRGTCGSQLSKFKIPRSESTGKYVGDPFKWPLLTISSDAGPDMTCLDHFLSYGVKDINFSRFAYPHQPIQQRCPGRCNDQGSGAAHPSPRGRRGIGRGKTHLVSSPVAQRAGMIFRTITIFPIC